jgi:hypothetical protein
MKRYHKAEIKNGKFISDKQRFRQSIGSLPDGRYLFCLISTQDRTPRDWQNYYFAILGEWSLDTGYTKDDLHQMIKSELFPQVFETETSTTALDGDQWQILMWNLENWLILKFENR